MKFTITPSNIRQGFKAALDALPARTTLPSLSHVKVSADKDGILLTGTDNDIGVLVRLPADVEVQGEALMPGRKAMEIFNATPNAPISISTDGDHATIQCGRYRSRLNGLPAEEAARIPSFDFTGAGRISAALLQDMIFRTAWAASTEETRPILQGVLWKLSGSEMRMVATDGHRMADYSIPMAGDSALQGEFIVPRRAMEAIRRHFTPDEDIEVARQDNHLAFRQGGVEIFCRLIEGPYPNFERVIPKDNDKHAIADVASLGDVVKRALILASSQTHRIRFSLNQTGRVGVDTPDLGDSGEEFPFEEYVGDPMDIGFNGQYATEVLKYIPSERVRMTFKAPERAAVFHPVEEKDRPVPAYRVLLMPLRLLD
jgi:DNA polymerase-3 subunit beta